MSGDLKMPFCLAVALHAGAAGVMAVRERLPGESGAAPRTSVIGVVELPGAPSPPAVAREDERVEPDRRTGPDEPQARHREQTAPEPPAELCEDCERATSPVADVVAAETAELGVHPEAVATDRTTAAIPEHQTPPGSPEVPGAAEVTAGAGADSRTVYLASVATRLHAAKRYPPDARRFGVEGTAVVAFTIAADGRASDIRVESASGDADLDGESVATVARASPFAPLPPELGADRLRVSVPVAFRITR